MIILVALFKCVGLLTNRMKTKGMACVPGRIRTCLLEDVYTNSHMGLMARDKWLRRRVQCDLYNEEILAASLTSHLKTQHDVYQS